MLCAPVVRCSSGDGVRGKQAALREVIQEPRQLPSSPPASKAPAPQIFSIQTAEGERERGSHTMEEYVSGPRLKVAHSTLAALIPVALIQSRGHTSTAREAREGGCSVPLVLTVSETRCQ